MVPVIREFIVVVILVSEIIFQISLLVATILVYDVFYSLKYAVIGHDRVTALITKTVDKILVEVGVFCIMSKITHQINKKLATELVKTIDNFLFDCDGVLWHSNAAIPGCPEALQKLKQLGKRIFYVSNSSSKTRAQVVEKCHQMGYPAELENIVCTAHTSALYLKNMNFTGKVYLVGNPSMAAEMDALGIRHEGLGPDLVSEDVDYQGYFVQYQKHWTPDPEPDVVPADMNGFEAIVKYQAEWKLNPEVNCVLVGFDPHLSYIKMIKGATYASNKNNLFFATGEDAFLPSKGLDVVIPGTGSIVHAVKVPARREPLVIGKPGTAMFDLLHEVHGLEAEKTLMVGDNLKTDIAMAAKCNLKSILVLTGVDDLQHVEENQRSDDPHTRHMVPDYYIDSFAHVGEFIADLD